MWGRWLLMKKDLREGETFAEIGNCEINCAER